MPSPPKLAGVMGSYNYRGWKILNCLTKKAVVRCQRLNIQLAAAEASTAFGHDIWVYTRP